MMNLEELKKNNELHDLIDWNMTHEEAVRLYLEWGNNWSSGSYVIKSKKDISYYFVINTWGEFPMINFIKRNQDGSKELAIFKIPNKLSIGYIEKNGSQKGVYSLDEKIKEWLKTELKLN